MRQSKKIRPRIGLRRRVAAVLGAFVFVTAPLMGALRAEAADTVADIRIGPGTVLELSAAGVPDFRFKVPVDADGDASFPLLDPMRVEGLSLADLRQHLKQALPHKVFHDRGADGRDSFITLSADEIVLDIAEYQPIYVGGDVARPGAVPFRPGLTVRQAITLAGGFGTVPEGGGDQALLAADIKGEIQAQTIELERQKAHAAGLQALLSGVSEVDIRHELKANLPARVLDRIAGIETQYLASSLRDQANEVKSLQDSAAEIQKQIDYLEQERKSQESGLAQQSKDLDRVRSLFTKGAATISQVNDEERQYGYASERMYQVAAQAMQATVAAGEVKRRIDGSVDQRRIRFLADLQDANTRADVAAARLSALNDKLARSGIARPQGGLDPSTSAEITLHRQTEAGQARTADLQDRLIPGDDLTITLPGATAPLD